MEKYYKLLGLSPAASEEQVKTRYEKLKKNYDPAKFSDPGQKRHAEKSLREITDAYNRIIDSLHPYSSRQAEQKSYSSYSSTQSKSAAAGAFASAQRSTWQRQHIPHIEAEVVEDSYSGYGTAHKTNRREIYDYVRRVIQNGDYDSAIAQLNSYSDVEDAEWQFLMGSALYYNGYVSESYRYFKRAVELAPANKEYSAVFNRMNNSRRGNVYSSPYNRRDITNTDEMCDDVCTALQCLMCINCMRR